MRQVAPIIDEKVLYLVEKLRKEVAKNEEEVEEVGGGGGGGGGGRERGERGAGNGGEAGSKGEVDSADDGFDIYHLFQGLTLDVIGQTGMGKFICIMMWSIVFLRSFQ